MSDFTVVHYLFLAVLDRRSRREHPKRLRRAPILGHIYESIKSRSNHPMFRLFRCHPATFNGIRRCGRKKGVPIIPVPPLKPKRRKEVAPVAANRGIHNCARRLNRLSQIGDDQAFVFNNPIKG
jgi:hypothetical protein